MGIQYFTEDITFNVVNQKVLFGWIERIISDHHYKLSEINYIFCSDDYLLKINQEHLGHDYFTDIITFDHADEDGLIESDIFISIDRVKENAEVQQTSFDRELYRVMIHGILHLLGYRDKTEEEKRLMREKEDACLSLLKI